MIYEFYSNLTSAPIVNYLNGYFPGTKLLSYNIITSKMNRFVAGSLGIEDDDVQINSKVFTFGWNKGVYSLIIQTNDTISLSETSFPKEELKNHLIQVVRDYKISQVL